MALAKTLLIVVLGTVIVSSSPVVKRSLWNGGRIEADSECVEIPENVAAYCGYTHTKLPNIRGHTTISEAMKEFNDYISLINSQLCSNFLGTFVCFYYFPLTHAHLSCQDPRNLVLPCKETCEEAITEECSTLVGEHFAAWNGWEEHLKKCDQFPSNTSNQCAYGEKGIFPSPPLPDSTTTQATAPQTTIISTPESTTTQTSAPSTEEPSEETTTNVEPTTEALPKCPGTCKYRANANGATFTPDRNPHYSFALKATVIRSLTRNEFEVSVIESYDLRTCIDGQMVNAPSLSGTVTLVAPYDHCSENPVSDMTGQTVIISGTYEKASDGSIKLTLDCTKRPLFGAWEKKYDRKNNLRDWISSANSERQNGC